MPQKRFLFYISQNYSFAILRPLQKALLERGDKVFWFVEGKSVNSDYFAQNEQVILKIDDVFSYCPDAILYPGNIAPTFLPGINVAIFHGFDAGKLDKKGNNDHYKNRNCFDLYCTQGPESTGKFLDLQKQIKRYYVKETGWCALDDLFSEPKEKTNDKPVILFCSTFSKKLSSAPHLFEKIRELSEKGNWRWVIQFHPKMPYEIVELYKSIQSEHLTFVETDNVIPLLQEADVMVCDTSSVLIMFLLQLKPVVTFKNVSPKNYLIDIDNAELLESSINDALKRPEYLIKNIQKFIDNTHPYQDGKSAQRVLNAIDETLNKPKLKKKNDLIRYLKMRKKLKFWKF